MGELTQHDGRVRIGALTLSDAELLALRPNAPRRPDGIVTRRYDGMRHTLSDGSDQRAGPVPWPEGDQLLAEETQLAAELAALRGGAFADVAARPDTGAAERRSLNAINLEILDALVEDMDARGQIAPALKARRDGIKAKLVRARAVRGEAV